MLFLTIRIFSNLMVVRCKVFSRNAERERETSRPRLKPHTTYYVYSESSYAHGADLNLKIAAVLDAYAPEM